MSQRTGNTSNPNLMKMKWVLSLLAGLLLFTAKAFSQDTHFFVFLCFGQSNMEGFPGIEQQDKGPVDERFQVLAAVNSPNQGREKGSSAWRLCEHEQDH